MSKSNVPLDKVMAATKVSPLTNNARFPKAVDATSLKQKALEAKKAAEEIDPELVGLEDVSAGEPTQELKKLTDVSDT